MAKKAKKPDLSSAEVLVSAPASQSHNVVCAWHEAPIVPPEILREWLNEECEKITSAINDLHSRIERIRESGNPDRLQASSIVLNGLDFLNIAELSQGYITDGAEPMLSQAFATGLRIGLLRERLQSLADGRYKQFWNATDAGERGAEITNRGTAETYAELHPKIKIRVDELMTEGKAFTPATEATARELNVSGRYVRSVYGPNPSPRNKGRKR